MGKTWPVHRPTRTPSDLDKCSTSKTPVHPSVETSSCLSGLGPSYFSVLMLLATGPPLLLIELMQIQATDNMGIT